MPASFAPSAAPANALLMWTDGRSIYIELPTREGLPPCVLSFRLSEQGLSKALAILCKHADVAGEPVLAAPMPRKDYVGTVSQHALAESILRKMRIVK